MSKSHLSRVVWKVSLPIILAAASENLLHLIDTLFLAHVGVTELGAIAIADSVLLLSLVIPLSFVEALQILASRRAGQRRPAAVGAAFNAGFLAVLVISFVTSIALKLLWPLVGNLFAAPGPIETAVADYLQIAAYGIFFIAASFTYSALLMSSGNTRPLIPATILLAATSVPLSYALIFGKFGFHALGMRGAALGSLAAEAVTFLFLTFYVVRAFDSARYRIFRFHSTDWRSLRLLTRLSASIATQRSLEVIRWFVFFLILERVSLEALAIANIVYTCHLVFWIPTEGFAETSYSLVSRFVGRNQPQRIGSLVRDAIRGALLVTAPFLLLALCIPRWFFAAFASEWGLLGNGGASLRIVALAMLVAIPGEMWLEAVLGTGDILAALGIEFILTTTMLGAAYLTAIPLGWPLQWVWLSLPISWAVCLFISYWWMKSRNWQRLHTRFALPDPIHGVNLTHTAELPSDQSTRLAALAQMPPKPPPESTTALRQ